MPLFFFSLSMQRRCRWLAPSDRLPVLRGSTWPADQDPVATLVPRQTGLNQQLLWTSRASNISVASDAEMRGKTWNAGCWEVCGVPWLEHGDGPGRRPPGAPQQACWSADADQRVPPWWTASNTPLMDLQLGLLHWLNKLAYLLEVWIWDLFIIVGQYLVYKVWYFFGIIGRAIAHRWCGNSRNFLNASAIPNQHHTHTKMKRKI